MMICFGAENHPHRPGEFEANSERIKDHVLIYPCQKAKEAVGGAIHYVTDTVGAVVDTLTDAVTDVYQSVKKIIRKVF